MPENTRDALRAKLFGKHEFKSKVVILFGEEVELRQPSLKQVLSYKEGEDPQKEIVNILVNYCYVPGTDIKIFEDTDLDLIGEWPFNEEFKALQDAIAELTGVEDAQVGEQRKN